MLSISLSIRPFSLISTREVVKLAARTMSANMYSSRIENSSGFVDLRSDTLTVPCEAMRKIIAEAEVGDDVYGEDPIVNRLEDRCARLFGKEDALFVCSGTMGNLLAVLVHCQRGDEIIVGRESHIHRWEQGNYAQIGGISASTVAVDSNGQLPLSEIKNSIRVNDFHMPTSRLICLENTHNFAGGKPLPLEYLKEVRNIADESNLLVHIDGARLYNAAIATGSSIAEIGRFADSLTMCFSKGLGAPIGSILVGAKEFIEKARRRRKAIGGGWRQAGILAAAAEYSLDMAEITTKKDHEHAKRLASGINQVAGETGVIRAVEENITNIVVVHTKNGMTPTMLSTELRKFGVLAMAFDDTRIRLVLHKGIESEHVEKTIQAFQQILRSL